MAKLNDSQMITAALGAGLVLTLAAGGGIWWAMGLAEEKQAEITVVEGQVSEAEGKIRQIPKLESDVIILRENVENYVKILPDQDLLTDFLRTLENFQRQSGARLTTYTPRPPTNRNKFRNYTYAISCETTTWQLMKFMSLIESFERFIKIKTFTLNSGDKPELIGTGEVIHRVQMQLETYVYLGKNQGQAVQIPNYASKREKLRDQIVRSSQQIKLETYEYKETQERRDPFVDPRQNASGPRDDSNSTAEAQRVTLERVSAIVADLVAVHGRYQDPSLDFLEQFKLEKELQKQLAAVRSEVDLAAAQGLFSGTNRYSAQWQSEVMEPYVKIRDELEGVEISDGFMSEAELEQLSGDMRAAMRRGNLEEARSRYLAAENRLSGLPADDSRLPLAEAAAELFNRIEMITEFQKVPLEIGGVVVQEAGKSGLLVNGISYEEGDYLTSSLLLKSVGRESAEFVYKGYTIRKSW